ncbi:hypothetical protein MNBD_PLANCTO03-2315 [hydrothermal vent metagenome]|uniref:AAA domain-containing protein n=1 Tax=hydrothermal vent metagenome TaxID=652676 RepID=A0A3B1E076_9ZZZZ
MTTASPTRPPQAFSGRPQAPAAQTANIDVVKILKKYIWILMASGIIGVLVGIAAHLILRQVYPIFKPQVVFQVLPPTLNTGEVVVGTDEDEQARFALTQVAQMKSDDIIQRVVSDPRLQQNGGEWYQSFVTGNSFQADDAAEWLQDHLGVKLIPNTDIIEMSLGWKNASDITAVLGFVKEIYLIRLAEHTRDQNAPQRDALENQIRQLEETFKDKQNLRDRILDADKVDSLEQRFAAASFELNTVLATLHEIRTSTEAAKTQLSIYETELNSAGGPTYSDELIAAVEMEPLIQNTLQTIASLDAQKSAMQHQGIGPDHRAMLTTDALIASWTSKLDEQRERLLRKRFAAVVDSLNNTIATFTAQSIDLSNQQEVLVDRLIDLSKTQVKVDDIETEIENTLLNKSEMEAQLQSLKGIAGLSTAQRIVVLQNQTIPDKPVFPDILYMVPAGVVLVLGLTTGIVFLRELLDQRVKGPGDIAMIPHTRVLGYIPDACECSCTPKDQVQHAFAKAPRGVLAESFRQIRSPLLKHADRAGHKTIMVMAGMPSSGTSTVVANLAEATAGAGKKTLVIDANFRRPTQHKFFGISDAPGLADILADASTLSMTAQATGSANLSILPAGSAAARIVERFASEKFAELLAEASAEYDIIFIDVPPAIIAGDGLSIANRCDASVLVVKAYAEKRGLVSRIRNELGDARAEFLGVIVNSVRASAGGYLRSNIRASQDYAGDAA